MKVSIQYRTQRALHSALETLGAAWAGTHGVDTLDGIAQARQFVLDYASNKVLLADSFRFDQSKTMRRRVADLPRVAIQVHPE